MALAFSFALNTKKSNLTIKFQGSKDITKLRQTFVLNYTSDFQGLRWIYHQAKKKKKGKEINFIFTTYPVITRLETCFVFLVHILIA